MNYGALLHSSILLFLILRQALHYHLTHVNRWSDCVGYRIEIVNVYNINHPTTLDT